MGLDADEWYAPAFVVHHSHDNLFLNNVISSSVMGMLLNASSDNTLKGNHLEDSGYGLALFYASDDNIIENSQFSQNKVNLVLDDAHRNVITGNNFILGGQYSAYDDSDDNVWSSNYWSDHTGPDDDHDGIVDSARVITPTVSDPSPLVDSRQIVSATVPPMPEVPVPPPVGWDPLHITDDTVWQGATISLTENLVIESGATMTLTGVTLVISRVTHLDIEVLSGGVLNVEDSVIQGAPDQSYSIWVHKGGRLVMRHSELLNAGDWCGNAGLILRGDGAVIENSVIRGGYFGILIQGSSNHRITHNTISECFDGISFPLDSVNTVITNNVVSKCIGYGITPGDAPYSTVKDNTILECGLLRELTQYGKSR